MLFSRLVLLFLQLGPYIASARPLQEPVRFNFTGYTSPGWLVLPNGTTVTQNNTAIGSLRLSNTTASAVAEICSLNVTQPEEPRFYNMNCIEGYIAHFVPGEKMLAFETPTIHSFLDSEPAFPLNMTYGNGVIEPTGWQGAFECDGKRDPIPIYWICNGHC